MESAKLTVLGVSPDTERHTPADRRLGAYDSESETPALHITHPNLGAFLFVILVGVQDGGDPLHSGC